MVKVGDLVSIKKLSDNSVSEPIYIVVKIETVDDNLNLYRYRKYKLFDYTRHKVNDEVVVWDHLNGMNYNLNLHKHNCYSYPYSLYFKIFSNSHKN